MIKAMITRFRAPEPVATERTGPRYAELLVWFMRFVGALWLCKGLMHWSMVLGVDAGPGRRFADLATATQAATILFAVVDVIAGVGLWMVSAWGAVVWIVAAGLHAGLDVLAPQVFGRQLGFIAAVVTLVAAYASLTWLSAREVWQGSSTA